MTKAEMIVKKMYENDAFSQWLGIEIICVREASCHLKMMVRSEMTNGFSIAHGGITYSLADTALAFAANSRGYHAYSIHTEIEHLEKVNNGDWLEAIAEEIAHRERFGLYQVKILRNHHSLCAAFKGMVYLSSRVWEI